MAPVADAGPDNFVAIDPDTGRTLWRFSGEGKFEVPPLSSAAMVVAASDSALYGIRVDSEDE